MSKTLYLMRHGKAEQTPGLRDFDRGLVERGISDARAQAKLILASEMPDRFVVSSALRTTQTALNIQDELGISKDRFDFEDALYLCSIQELLSCINDLDDLWKTVCIIGHNPSINYMTEYLSKEDIGHMATSGVAKLTFEGRWSEMGIGTSNLVFYQSPPKEN